MAGRYVGIGNKEQISIFFFFLCWVDIEKFKLYENCVGYYNIKTTTTVHVTTDSLICPNLSISVCRKETYDWASDKIKEKSVMKL